MKAQTPTTTFVAEDLIQALNYQPARDIEGDLPDAAWLAAVAIELRDVHELELQLAIESVVENQATALQMREAGLAYADVATYAADRLPV